MTSGSPTGTAPRTADANVPSTDLPAHQRLHQYTGAHNESYEGATITIDGDYVGAATAAAGALTTAAAAGPSLSVAPVATEASICTPCLPSKL